METEAEDLEIFRKEGIRRPVIIYESESMEKVLRRVEILSGLPLTVLITGETGAGKGMVARELHERGNRRKYVEVNCAALNEQLAEPALFGHIKGAFTGAYTHARGFFEEANDGTLFLDEIGLVPLGVQAKLLKAVEDGVYTPVGSTRPQKSSARLVAAPSRDLEKMVRAGDFLEDLYFRLNMARLEVPPLRTRPEDIGALALYFLTKINKSWPNGELNGAWPGPFEELTRDTVDLLESYPWPGNVRELEHTISRAAVESIVTRSDRMITRADINFSYAPVKKGDTILTTEAAVPSEVNKGHESLRERKVDAEPREELPETGYITSRFIVRTKGDLSYEGMLSETGIDQRKKYDNTIFEERSGKKRVLYITRWNQDSLFQKKDTTQKQRGMDEVSEEIKWGFDIREPHKVYTGASLVAEEGLHHRVFTKIARNNPQFYGTQNLMVATPENCIEIIPLAKRDQFIERLIAYHNDLMTRVKSHYEANLKSQRIPWQ